MADSVAPTPVPSVGSPTSSLAVRAALAVALLVGFYLLALGIAAALLFVPYAEIVYAGRLHIKLTLVCVLGALGILWAIMPRPDRFEAPGPRLTAEEHPQLFALLHEVAAATKQAMPVEVYLVPDVNAWVMERGGFLGVGSRRVMGLGLPLLQVLSVDQMRAVIAHEFGHYHGGDTALGPWLYKTRTAIGRTLEHLGGSILQLPFRWYGTLFLRLTHAVSRQQEYIADALAARIAGAQALIGGLRVVHGAAPAFDAYWRSEVQPVLYSGHIAPLASGFGHFVTVPTIAGAMDQHINTELAEGKADPYDTHPPLRERLAALAPLPALAGTANNAPALSLLSNVNQLEMQLLSNMIDAAHVQGMRSVEWGDVGSTVYLPQWQHAVHEHQAALASLTVADLASVLGESTVLQFSNAQTGDEEQQGALGVLGSALSVALHKAGWIIHALPGEPVELRQGEVVLEPFALVQQLATEHEARSSWQHRAAELGIASLPLA